MPANTQVHGIARARPQGAAGDRSAGLGEKSSPPGEHQPQKGCSPSSRHVSQVVCWPHSSTACTAHGRSSSASAAFTAVRERPMPDVALAVIKQGHTWGWLPVALEIAVGAERSCTTIGVAHEISGLVLAPALENLDIAHCRKCHISIYENTKKERKHDEWFCLGAALLPPTARISRCQERAPQRPGRRWRASMELGPCSYCCRTAATGRPGRCFAAGTGL